MRWITATAHIDIARQRQDVWNFVAEPANMDAWVNGVSGAHLTGAGLMGPGAKIASKYTYGGKTYDIEYEVMAFEPPRRMAIEALEGPFPFRGQIDLAEAAAGTRMGNTITAGSDSWMTSVMFAAGGPALRWMMRRQLRKELRELKGLLENGQGA